MHSKKSNEARNRRHKTRIDRTITGIRLISSWLTRSWILIGDGGFSCVRLARACLKRNVTLISRLHLDACLHDFVLPSSEEKKGRKREKGDRIASLSVLAHDSKQAWEEVSIAWYAGKTKTVRLLSSTHLWYTSGEKPLPIRWMIVIDPDKPDSPNAFFSTDLSLSPTLIVEYFILRWNIEVTFEETRAYLGVETQRQWNDKAINRSTPLLMGLYSSVVLIASQMNEKQAIQPISSAWYRKN